MKILHLATFLQGGAGRIIKDLALHQRADGHDVRVVTSRSETPGFGNYQEYLSALRDAGVPLLLVDSLFQRDYTVNLNALRHIDSSIGATAPEIVHAHAAVPALMGVLLAGARRDSVGVITTMHGWSRTKTPAQAEADVRALNLSHRVVTPSAHSSSLLQDLGVESGRLHIVPYGVGETLPALADLDEALAGRMREARRDARLVVACVGTVGERKRQRLLIEALRHVADPSSYLLVFIGDGETAGLAAAAEAAGMSPNVIVHGYSPAARRLACDADVLVLPSSREGQPLTVLESFCDGNLVLASDIPELAELVMDGESGWLFEPDSAVALAAALGRAANTSAQERDRMVRRARRQYLESHSLADMNSRYLNHYFDLALEDRSAGHPIEPFDTGGVPCTPPPAGVWNV